MEARKKRIIKSGAEYDHLFPKANVETHTVRKNAGVSDTVALIPQVVRKTLSHTKGIAPVLKGRSDYETCRNIWHFVYSHIAYRKDKEGYEQIRSPARTWHDRKEGVDCDCYTTFISSILTNLGIRHKLRITKYSRDYFQHIYPVALLSGRPVPIDCVTDQFDYEVPFSAKKDYPMDLQYLDGIGDADYNQPDGLSETGDLGKLFKRKGGKPKKKHKLKIKVNLKKVLNIVNKLNPATVALRNGVLASMKLNIGNVAKRLRWSYVTEAQAKAKGMDMGRWHNLVKARQKLENIFYDAGGKPSNFKKAILHGKGNKDHAVHGLEGLGSLYIYRHLSPAHPHHPIHAVNMLHKHMPLRQILGDEMFYSENERGMLGELGEPASMAMIAAASSVIAAIAGTLKKIGDIFGGKGKGSADFNEEANAEAEKEIPAGKGADNTADNPGSSGDSAPGGSKSLMPDASDDGGGSSGGSARRSSSALAPSGGDGGGVPAASSGGGSGGGDSEGSSGGSADAGSSADGKDDNAKEGFWDKNKKWVIPTGIGVAGLGLIALAAHASHGAAAAASAHAHKPAGKPVNGTPSKHKNHHRKTAKGKGNGLSSVNLSDD